MTGTTTTTIGMRQVALLATHGVNGDALNTMKKALMSANAKTKVVAPSLGFINGGYGKSIDVDQSFITTAFLSFDAIYIPGGAESVAALKTNPEALHFVREAYRACKTISVDDEGVELLVAAIGLDANLQEPGVIIGNGVIEETAEAFIQCIARHCSSARNLLLRTIPA